jgi:hypothetical protein
MEEKSYTKLSSSEETKRNLMIAAVYLTAYELVKWAIIDQLKHFYIDGIQRDSIAMEQRYQKDVLSLDKNKFLASCRWLEQMGAITKEDIEKIAKLREHRNKVAHELPEFLVDDAVNINTAYIYKMYELLTKIDVWRFMQVELPINPELSAHTDETISAKSGPMLILELLFSFILFCSLRSQAF